MRKREKNLTGLRYAIDGTHSFPKQERERGNTNMWDRKGAALHRKITLSKLLGGMGQRTWRISEIISGIWFYSSPFSRLDEVAACRPLNHELE